MKKTAFFLLSAWSVLLAQEEALEKQEKLFVSHVELGYIETKGNTDTQTFNLDGKATKELQKHNFQLKFDAQYATDSGNEIVGRGEKTIFYTQGEIMTH